MICPLVLQIKDDIRRNNALSYVYIEIPQVSSNLFEVLVTIDSCQGTEPVSELK